jgi:hypothetical protein
MRASIHTILLLLLLFFLGCANSHTKTMPLHNQTILPAGESAKVLNSRANNPISSQAERARAIFTLFAHHIRPGYSAVEVHQVLGNAVWLSGVHVNCIRVLAGWVPVDATAVGDTIFCMQLFPVGENEGARYWAIYFRLSGQHQDEDGLAFLKGQNVTGNPRLVEYALCFPHSSKPGHLLGRMENFSQQGIYVYNEW